MAKTTNFVELHEERHCNLVNIAKELRRDRGNGSPVQTKNCPPRRQKGSYSLLRCDHITSLQRTQGRTVCVRLSKNYLTPG